MSTDHASGTWAGAHELAALLGRLREAADARELLALASDEARRELPFDRALVLTVDATRLTAADSDALADEDSDVLRRRVLAQPVELEPKGADERPAAATELHVPAVRDAVAAALGLASACVGLVTAAGTPLAVLVVDRDGPAPDPAEESDVAGFAAVLGVAVEHAILRGRAADVSSELRHLMTSAQALLLELQHAPLALPSTSGHRVVLPWDALGAAPAPGEGLLSAREVEILDRLVAGRSNREIAEELVLAPDTIKGHVARILRKLGAANRVEAVARYLAMTSGTRS
jgi:DNA-binding CsgD family transcriptional regulator